MKTTSIAVSADFKKATIKSFFALFFFFICYSVILVISLSVAAACIYAGFIVAITLMSYIGIIIGGAIMGMGALIAYFILKSFFKLPKKQDTSQFIQITEKNEPELFKIINEVADAVGTKRPKNVYITGEVNASVFYNSNFWSMFFPVRKNLIIGLGLVNALTREELKGILAHEFGHFSQRSMIFGSYVHNINKILHDLLFDNDSFNSWSQSLANINQVFWFFVKIAVLFVNGVQWILQKIYVVLNTSNLSLSRQMEFHADHVAATVVGKDPMKQSLLRMSLADFTFNQVLNSYNEKVEENIKSENFFKDHYQVMLYTAERNNLSFKAELPVVQVADLKKYNKTKLNITDQWASHPSTDDRLASLEKVELEKASEDLSLANTLFSNIEQIQKDITEKMYQVVSFSAEPTYCTSIEFIEGYKQKIQETTYDLSFNSYFDDKFPATLAIPIALQAEELSFDELFSQEKVDWVYEALALKNDIESLSNLKNQKVKRFEYDGTSYHIIRVTDLIKKLQTELDLLEAKIRNNDYSIYQYFYRLANSDESKKRFRERYLKLNERENALQELINLYSRLNVTLDKIRPMDDFIDIRKELNLVVSEDEKLKEHVTKLLKEKELESEIKDELRDTLDQYAKETDKDYLVIRYRLEKHLEGLFTAHHVVFSFANHLRYKELLRLTKEMKSLTTKEKNVILEEEQIAQ